MPLTVWKSHSEIGSLDDPEKVSLRRTETDTEKINSAIAKTNFAFYTRECNQASPTVSIFFVVGNMARIWCRRQTYL
jgi:hypothetical protein